MLDNDRMQGNPLVTLARRVQPIKTQTIDE
jgi:hypothetical protein